ncbi:MAG TPA: hypothetical protein DEF64_07645 [Ruminococcaceae bacterium]|nr:hypothetical protein [Oscillospiraceae bacterium]
MRFLPFAVSGAQSAISRKRLYEANATANLHKNIQKQHKVGRPYIALCGIITSDRKAVGKDMYI